MQHLPSVGSHVLHDEVCLSVHDDGWGRATDLPQLLDDLSFVPASAPGPDGSALSLCVRGSPSPDTLPGAGGRVLSRTGGLQVGELHGAGYVTDGSSLLRVEVPRGRGVAQIADTFRTRPRELRHRFWAFGVVKLLRSRALFGLHAAGVSTPGGMNLLFVGPSGCGKTTMAIGLIREGGLYLSDDAILLRARQDAIEALALRKPFSVDAALARDCQDLCLGPGRSSRSGARKRRADVQARYPRQRLERFRPHALVFPRIVSGARSRLRAVAAPEALKRLMMQSGPELFDRDTMPLHLNVLSRLVRETTAYELSAGSDVHRSPPALHALLESIRGGSAWRGSSSN